MAFSTSALSTGLGDGSGRAEDVSEGEEVITAELSFKAINGEHKVRFEQATWPADDYPPPSSSLLAIAPTRGLLAAGGPNALLIGRTQDIRDAFYVKGSGNVNECKPFLTIPHSRLTQVAFSSNEAYLMVSEQSSGQIIAYSSDDLAAGNTREALRLSTNGPLQALVPNPAPKSPHLFAIVTMNGELQIADFQQGQLSNGANGSVLAENVTCVTWSNKGKQIVAGLRDGTAIQLNPDGQVQAKLSKSPSAPADAHVSSIAWLENDLFFLVYSEADSPDSTYHIVVRDKSNATNPLYKFHKLPDLAFPMDERISPHQYIARLRHYHPEKLKDLLIVASSASPDISMVAKPNSPLEGFDLSTAGEGGYICVLPKEDTERAQLPFGSDGQSETFAIGMAFDLSNKDPVSDPLPKDFVHLSIERSEIPIPHVVILNNDGVLNVWSVIYNASVIDKIPYPGFEVTVPKEQLESEGDQMAISARPSIATTTAIPAFSSQGPVTTTQQASPFAAVSSPSTTEHVPAPFGNGGGFGSGEGFGKPSPLGSTGASSWTRTGFGSDKSQQSGFGTPNNNKQPAFGQSGSLGSSQQTAPAFGQTGTIGGSKPSTSTFGTANSLTSTPAFGKLGFGGSSQQQTSVFGQSGFASHQPASASPFATTGGASSSGFGQFANKGGFGQTGSGSSGSPFGELGKSGSENKSPFASANAGGGSTSIFGQPSSSSAFGQKQSTSSPFGPVSGSGKSAFGENTFKLPSSFKGDGTAKDDLPKPSGSTGFGFADMSSLLEGNNQNKALASPSKEEEMDDDDDDGSATSVENKGPTTKTPPSTIGPPKATPPAPTSGIFDTKPSQVTPVTNTGWSFTNFPSTTPKDTPAASKTLFSTKPVTEESPAVVQKSQPFKAMGPTETHKTQNNPPFIKAESPSDNEEGVSGIPEPPLPPDPTSKPGYQAGDTSASSLNSMSRLSEDAPLPPDFVPANRSAEPPSLQPQESSLPEDIHDMSSDFEASGEDLSEDGASSEGVDGPKDAEDQFEELQPSPESSFGRAGDESTSVSLAGGAFTKIESVNQGKAPKLFGEVGGQVPMFPPPRNRVDESPRSPSPVRKVPPHGLLRSPDRSFSAPPRPRSIIDERKNEYRNSPIAAQAANFRQQEEEKDRLRREAELKAKAAAEAQQTQPLEDEEDILLQAELARPASPTQNLDPFMTIEPGKHESSATGKTDIPAQIEKLYQDINSMVITLGINARSLSAFMQYHRSQDPNENWPHVLGSETPLDALNDEWVLGDIEQLQEGNQAIESILDRLQIRDVAEKLEQCHQLLTSDITDLRAKIMALRKTTNARVLPENSMNAPLSAEQSSKQHNLRKLSASVHSKLVRVEDEVAILRAKIAEITPSSKLSNSNSTFGRQSPQKKPTVEAVVNTVSKMTSMAEKKSADLDVLEAQIKKLKASNGKGPQTPETNRSLPYRATPKSGASSIYHTPESKGRRSTNSTPGRNQMAVVSAEDREKWKLKAKKKQEIAATLKKVLEEKRTKVRTGSIGS